MTAPYDIRVDTLDLSVRLANVLYNQGIHTVGDLCKLSSVDILKFKYAGRKTLMEVQDLLAGFDLQLADRYTPELARRSRMPLVLLACVNEYGRLVETIEDVGDNGHGAYHGSLAREDQDGSPLFWYRIHAEIPTPKEITNGLMMSAAEIKP